MAEKYRWIEKLANHPLFRSLVSESEEKLSHNESRNLLAERNGEIFVWLPSKNRVLTTNLKNVMFGNPRAKNYQVSSGLLEIGINYWYFYSRNEKN